MIVAGVHKSALEWRRRDAMCPSCGRHIAGTRLQRLHAPSPSARPSSSARRPRRARLAHLRVRSSSSARPLSSTIVSRCGRAVSQAHDREPSHRVLRVVDASVCSSGRIAVHEPGRVLRQLLHRHEGRPAHDRARRRRAPGAAARASAGTGTGRSRGTRPHAPGSRRSAPPPRLPRPTADAAFASSRSAPDCASSSACAAASMSVMRRGTLSGVGRVTPPWPTA